MTKYVLIGLVSLCCVHTTPVVGANTIPLPFTPPSYITLPAGTLVVLETAERIPSERATIGKQVLFRVRTNVVEGGQVVIQTGALAVGRIKSIRKNTYNFPELVALEVTAVQTAEGKLVAVHGTEQVFAGLFPGESTVVEPGQTMTAMLMNNETICLP